MDLETLSKELRDQRELLTRIYVSAEKTRKYFLWTMIVTIALIVLPLIGLAFVLPAFVNQYTTVLGNIGV